MSRSVKFSFFGVQQAFVIYGNAPTLCLHTQTAAKVRGMRRVSKQETAKTHQGYTTVWVISSLSYHLFFCCETSSVV